MTITTDDATTQAAAPGTWTPGGTSAFAAPRPAPASRRDDPKKPTRTAGRSSRGRKRPGDELPYVPLPAPKSQKPVSPSEQKKLDKMEVIKEREADAAAIRINGTDAEGVEIPKKPWLQIVNAKRARPDEIAETLTDLAAMLESGESEHRSISALADQYSAYDIGLAYERVVRLLDRGVTLGDAMADQTDNFPPVVRELIGAAKMPKDMHRNLRQAAVIIVEADNIKSQLRSAMFKPGFMMFFLLVFTVLAVQVLLPMTADMFVGIGAETPPTTQIIMLVGEWLKWGLIAVAVLLFFTVAIWKVFLKKIERYAVKWDTFTLNAPLVGDVSRMAVAARFCDVLAASLSVGMSELDSLATASRACGNRALQSWVDGHISRQRYGLVSFGDVAKTELLPWNFRNRIETTTSITRRIEILRELAETFHRKSQDRLNRFAERVGPITEGIVIGCVVVVVLLIVSPILTFIPTLLATFA